MLILIQCVCEQKMFLVGGQRWQEQRDTTGKWQRTPSVACPSPRTRWSDSACSVWSEVPPGSRASAGEGVDLQHPCATAPFRGRPSCNSTWYIYLVFFTVVKTERNMMACCSAPVIKGQVTAKWIKVHITQSDKVTVLWSQWSTDSFLCCCFGCWQLCAEFTAFLLWINCIVPHRDDRMLSCMRLLCHVIGLLLILWFLFADARLKAVPFGTHNCKLCNCVDASV